MKKFKIEKIDNIVNGKYDLTYFSNQENEIFCLTINNKKYLINDKNAIVELENEDVVLLNFWTNISLISLLTGETIFKSGLNGSFVGLGSMDLDYFVVSDFSIFLINKESLFPWGYNFIPRLDFRF